MEEDSSDRPKADNISPERQADSDKDSYASVTGAKKRSLLCERGQLYNIKDLTNNDLAKEQAKLAELASLPGPLWNRHQYLGEYGKQALLVGAPAILAGVILKGVGFSILANYFFMWCGGMGGFWLFLSYCHVRRWRDVPSPTEKNGLEMRTRLIFAGIMTISMGLALSTGVFVVEVGSFSSKNITDGVEAALLVGAICGALSEFVADKLFSLIPKSSGDGKKS